MAEQPESIEPKILQYQNEWEIPLNKWRNLSNQIGTGQKGQTGRQYIKTNPNRSNQVSDVIERHYHIRNLKQKSN